MQVQLHTDHNITGRVSLMREVESALRRALRRFDAWLTRVEVHLSDQNNRKNGRNDKRCVLEARPRGAQPVAVSHQGATLGQAVDGAADRLARRLNDQLERLRRPKRPLPEGGPPRAVRA